MIFCPLERAMLLAAQSRRESEAARSSQDITRASALALESIKLSHKASSSPEPDAEETVKMLFGPLIAVCCRAYI
jgi:hypothetical protein